MKQKRYALIVAGGHGLRMGADRPKQFLLLAGLPVLMHTLNRFAPHVDAIVLVLPTDHHAYWQELFMTGYVLWSVLKLSMPVSILQS